MQHDYYATDNPHDTLLYRLCANDPDPMWAALRYVAGLARPVYLAAWHSIEVDRLDHEAFSEGSEPDPVTVGYHEAVCRIASSDADRWHDTYATPSILPVPDHDPATVRRAIVIALALVDGYIEHFACPHAGTCDNPPCFVAWATPYARRAMSDATNEALRLYATTPYMIAMCDTWRVWQPLP